MTRSLAMSLVVALLGVAAGCGGSASSPLKDPGGLGAIDDVPIPGPERPDPEVVDPPSEVGDAILVRFQVGPDSFHVLVTDPDGIDKLVDIYEGRQAFQYFSGLIRGGAGVHEENLPWSWYIPGDNVNVNVPGDPLTTVQGSLQWIENNLERLVPQDLHYGITSANASLVELIDYR